MARSAWRLPGYRVEELLGSGSSGEVWRGRVNSTGSAVALKRLWLSDAAQRKAALSEAAMLSSLDHPHLMQLHELRHVDDDAIVLVLDLAAGGSLATLLARRGRLTVGEVITAIAPIAAALAYAHHCGVVHGDVSAANILFTDIGLPLLADLGVARLLGDAAPVRTTPAYADPLVAAGSLPIPASDVFMLGAVALHALTGRPAWPGTVPTEVLEAAAAGGEQPDFAGRLAAAGVPEATAAVVARALMIDPAYRGTAAEFALELRHSGEPVAVELSAGRSVAASSVAASSVAASSVAARSVAARSVAASSVAARSVASALRGVESWPLESVPAVVAPTGSAPVPVVPFAQAQPLTYGVRAPSPFAPPAKGRHLARSRPRVATGLAVSAALLAASAASSIWWWPSGGGEDGHHRAAPALAVSTRPSTRPIARPSVRPGIAASAGPSSTAVRSRPARPPAHSPADLPAPSTVEPTVAASTPTRTVVARSDPVGRPLDATRAAAVLATLDARRAAAFGSRDPDLLAAVYSSPSLLARDRALLTTIVPAGCGLRGVRTRFTGIVVTARTPDEVLVRVRAALARSTLVCAGTPSGHAAGSAATAMLVDLVRQGSGYRIAAQHRE